MITINGKEYNLKYTMRGLFAYEQVTGVPFSPEKSLNIFTLIFCFLMMSNDDFRMTFEEFTDALDENPRLISEIYKWMNDETRRINLLSGADEPEEGEKKN